MIPSKAHSSSKTEFRILIRKNVKKNSKDYYKSDQWP
jgi:hypothetical protein